MLGCEFEGAVYLNKVGTFGISSAAEWWARLFGGAARALYFVIGPDWPVEVLAYADDLESLGAGRRGL
eukprot:2517448-Lingulodinium_polyedra.AAC.1